MPTDFTSQWNTLVGYLRDRFVADGQDPDVALQTYSDERRLRALLPDGSWYVVEIPQERIDSSEPRLIGSSFYEAYRRECGR